RRDAARRSLHGRLGIREGVRILLYAGRLHSMKRPHAVLQAFLRAEVENLALLFVGRDDDVTRPELAGIVPSCAAEKVRFTGELDGDELDEVFLAADGFISLSYRENFGFSLAEACAYGLPVIATPGHDLAHEMPMAAGPSGGVGWLLPDLSEAAAVQGIRQFATASSSRLSSMGQNARRWVAEHLSPEKFRERLFALMSC
ncbi:MAG: glycosyltransferase family 4 protein, partial [Planctomycetota bacterium]